MDADPDRRTGWLGALDDPMVGAALQALHDDPGGRWTVQVLARHVMTSRATLSRRFTQQVGEPPMTYLTRWRMTLAAAALEDTEDTVAHIAGQLGYDSEFAFSRAFKRIRGTAPSRHRAAAAAAAAT